MELSETILKKVKDSFRAQGLMTSLGAEIDHLGHGECTVTAPITPDASQQRGFAHAGLTFAIGDTAAGYAALTVMPDEAEVLTAEMTIRLLSPGRGSRLVAEGRVIRPGRRLVVAEANVWAEEGGDRRHVALLTGTLVPVTG